MRSEFEKHNEIMDFFRANPNYTAKTIGEKFGLKKSHVSSIISKFVAIDRELSVAPSCSKENVYFAFNGINERMFETDTQNRIIDCCNFSEVEKKQLKKLGFKI